MKTHFLFPNKFKKWGWVILFPCLIIGVASEINSELAFDFLEFVVREKTETSSGWTENFTNELAGIGSILGLLFVGFSKVKIEDEYTKQLRLDSLLWATYVNYALILLALIFTYDFGFLMVMQLNLITPLLLFIIRFHIFLARR